MFTQCRHWLAIIASVAFGLTLAACADQTARGRDATPPPAGGPTVQVVARNFSFTFAPDQVVAGSVTFLLRNDGPAPHDFAIRGNGVERKTPVIERGETARLTVELKPGRYTYICTVPGHDHLGMQGTLVVT